jgi:high-affinity iron transporter
MAGNQQVAQLRPWEWYRWVVGVGLAIVVGVMIWQGIVSAGVPDLFATNLHPSAVVINTSLIVFREGLEAILVLAAITASFVGAQAHLSRAVFQGAGWAFVASIVTWFIVVAIMNQINAPALHIQAATGLLVIVVLLVIMNWFLHSVYWTGWISLHNQRKHELHGSGVAHSKTMWGMMALGFSAVYRKGFEIVLFLQNVRLQVGTSTVVMGVVIGLAFTEVIGLVTF